jgi:maltose O-acetyltransferase
MTKRHVDLPPQMQAAIDTTIDAVDRRLSTADDPAVAVREILIDLFGDRESYDRYRSGDSLPRTTELRIRSYDPRNVLTETDRWAEQSPERLREATCLRYLWRAFDMSPLAHNVAVALPFRELLAQHLFAEAGENLRLFRGIKIQCGHNIEMGDNVVVHNDVLLDDRGKLELGDRVSIADRAHLHTHSHGIVDQTDVTTYRTIVEDDARLGYDSMVGAGCRVGENAMVGTSAMVRGDVPAHHVAVGSPAESIKVKPGWESVAREPGPLPDNCDRRRLGRTVPEGLDEFDEFGRDLSPPDAPKVE